MDPEAEEEAEIPDGDLRLAQECRHCHGLSKSVSPESQSPPAPRVNSYHPFATQNRSLESQTPSEKSRFGNQLLSSRMRRTRFKMWLPLFPNLPAVGQKHTSGAL